MANLYNRKKTISFSSQNKPSLSVYLRGLGTFMDTTIHRNPNGVVTSVNVCVKTALNFYTLQQKFTDFGIFTVLRNGEPQPEVKINSVCDFYEYLRGLGCGLTDEYIRSGALEYKTASGDVISVTYSTKFLG